MGRLKAFFHDEIAAREDLADPIPIGMDLPIKPYSMFHVLMERNEITGETRPLHIYPDANEAQADAALLRASYWSPALAAERITYYVSEGVPCSA